MRKLASIQRIYNISPIEGANAIDVGNINGWYVVVKKGEFRDGDLVVYVEIDSILPDRPEFEFLRPRGFKVKTIKLKKQVSQGICFPLDILPKGNKGHLVNWHEGDDVTELLGVKKYLSESEQEEFIPAPKSNTNIFHKIFGRFKWYRNIFFTRKPKERFPSWISKTDEERIQNCKTVFHNPNAVFYCTEKLDGSSMTTFIDKKGKFGVCSRNVWLKTPDEGKYWKVARAENLEEKLRLIRKAYGAKTVVLQGELIGEGVQKNKYQIKGHDFYGFNLVIDGERIGMLMFSILKEKGIKTAPFIDLIEPFKHNVDTLVELSKGFSKLNPKTIREGFVARWDINPEVSFKVINPDFLLKNDE